MTNFKVSATVPTAHQLKSIVTLMGWASEQPGGSYSTSFTFLTMEQAKMFLRQRLSAIFAETNMDEEEYAAALEQIENGYLEYDAATAKIEEVED